MTHPTLVCGQTVTLRIDTLVSDGRGLTRHDGQAIFVADALPGQTVEAEILSVKPRMAEATTRAVLKDAPDARPAACPHAGECGGCTWQAMPYAAQLAWKERFVRDALQRIGRIADPPVLPALPSPREWRYRNKMEFAFAGHGAELRLGLRRRGSHDVIDVTGCLLQSERAMRIVACVREAARQSGLPAWRNGTGLWRFLVIREPEAGGCLVELIVGPHPEAEQQAVRLAAHVRKACPDVDGFVLSLRRAAADVAYGERVAWRQGRTDLDEVVGGLRLSLGAGAFFQVNTLAAAVLYAEAASQIGQSPVESLWDLYCGVGSVGLYLAGHVPVGQIVGIEQSAGAVRLAQDNARRLGVRAAFHAGDVLRVMRSPALRKGHKPDLVVVDPPRAGLDAGVARLVHELGAERILYISCDPATLARDAARLTGYRLAQARPVDLFPQTPHVESTALFERAHT